MTRVTIHIYFSSFNTDTPEKKHSALSLGLSQFRKTLFYSPFVLSLLREEFHNVTMFNGK